MCAGWRAKNASPPEQSISIVVDALGAVFNEAVVFMRTRAFWVVRERFHAGKTLAEAGDVTRTRVEAKTKDGSLEEQRACVEAKEGDK